jgi:hypothetical protein
MPAAWACLLSEAPMAMLGTTGIPGQNSAEISRSGVHDVIPERDWRQLLLVGGNCCDRPVSLQIANNHFG